MAQCVRVSGIGVDGTLVGNVTFNPDTYYITINDNTGYFESSSLDFTRRFTLSFTFTNMAATTDTAIIFESSFLKLSLENGVIKIYKNGSLVGDSITPYLGYNTFKIDGWNNPDDLTIMFGRTSATDQVYVGSFTFPSTPETVKFLQGYSGASLSIAALKRPTSWVWITPYEGYRGIKGGTITHYWKNIYGINATKYGTLTENNGVASGFSTSNYYNAGLINIDSHNFEIGFKVYGYSTSQDNPVYANKDSRGYLPKIVVRKQGTIQVSLSNSTSGWNVCDFGSTESIPSDAWVWIKVSYDGTAYTINTSLDGQVYTEIGRYATTTTYSQNLNTIGACYDTGSTGLKTGYGGQIDLTGCYLNINGERVWDGSYISSRTEVTSADNYDYTTTENIYNCFGNNSILFENSTPGTYTVNIPFTGDYEITCVGAGGPAAMRGRYDDKGYGWGGGSGGAFKGVFTLAAGSYTVVVGSANNNTTAQSGNTQTLNPSDTTTHDSSIDGVVVCGGGGAGHYNTNYVGAAGAAPVLSLVPVSTVLNIAGNAGSYNSGGKGSAAAATCAGGASVYLDYGRGQGCRTSEYASNRSWINGTNGYVRIRSVM